jgi:hypothetical protein
VPFSSVSRYNTSDFGCIFEVNPASLSANIFFISHLAAKNATVILANIHCGIGALTHLAATVC